GRRGTTPSPGFAAGRTTERASARQPPADPQAVRPESACDPTSRLGDGRGAPPPRGDEKREAARDTRQLATRGRGGGGVGMRRAEVMAPPEARRIHLAFARVVVGQWVF